VSVQGYAAAAITAIVIVIVEPSSKRGLRLEHVGNFAVDALGSTVAVKPENPEWTLVDHGVQHAQHGFACQGGHGGDDFPILPCLTEAHLPMELQRIPALQARRRRTELFTNFSGKQEFSWVYFISRDL
jgi:hypothetical protein